MTHHTNWTISCSHLNVCLINCTHIKANEFHTNVQKINLNEFFLYFAHFFGLILIKFYFDYFLVLCVSTYLYKFIFILCSWHGYGQINRKYQTQLTLVAPQASDWFALAKRRVLSNYFAFVEYLATVCLIYNLNFELVFWYFYF